MKLKTATLFVAICLTVNFVYHFLEWIVFSFHLADSAIFEICRTEWYFNIKNLISSLLVFVPLIIFFFVLNSKQKGGENGQGHQQNS